MPRLKPITCIRCLVNQTFQWKYCFTCNDQIEKETERKRHEQRLASGFYNERDKIRRKKLRELLPPKKYRSDLSKMPCSECKRELPKGWFPKHGLTKKGRQKYSSRCRECLKPKRSLECAKRRGVKNIRRTPKALYQSLYTKQVGLCGICHLEIGTNKKYWHLDHITPIARGGKHEEGNLQLTHALCNLRKGCR